MAAAGIMIAQIKQAVASEYGIDLAKLSEPALHDRCQRNTYEFSRPRQVAMFLSKRLSRHSYSRIGDFFGGRDHSTVIHAVRAVEQRRKDDRELRTRMRRVALELLRARAR